MGHARVAFTLDRYGHLFPGAESEAGGCWTPASTEPGGTVHRRLARDNGTHPAGFPMVKRETALGPACTTSDGRSALTRNPAPPREPGPSGPLKSSYVSHRLRAVVIEPTRRGRLLNGRGAPAGLRVAF
jgi:hypothetical protein